MTSKAPKLKINSGLFYAAHIFASTEETRYYLNGVYVEPHPKGGVTMTATDGHRLACIYDRDGSTDRPLILTFDKKDLAKLKPSPSTENHELVTSGSEMTHGKFRIDLNTEKGEAKSCFFASEIDGTFPAYKKVIAHFKTDRKPCGEVGFNAKYLGDFGTAATMIGCALGFGARSPGIGMAIGDDDKSPALITFGPAGTAFGLIMALRTEHLATPPAWYIPEPTPEPTPEPETADGQKEAA